MSIEEKSSSTTQNEPDLPNKKQVNYEYLFRPIRKSETNKNQFEKQNQNENQTKNNENSILTYKPMANIMKKINERKEKKIKEKIEVIKKDFPEKESVNTFPEIANSEKSIEERIDVFRRIEKNKIEEEKYLKQLKPDEIEELMMESKLENYMKLLTIEAMLVDKVNLSYNDYTSNISNKELKIFINEYASRFLKSNLQLKYDYKKLVITKKIYAFIGLVMISATYSLLSSSYVFFNMTKRVFLQKLISTIIISFSGYVYYSIYKDFSLSLYMKFLYGNRFEIRDIINNKLDDDKKIVVL